MKQFIVVFDTREDGVFEASENLVDGMLINSKELPSDEVIAYDIANHIRKKMFEYNESWGDIDVDVYSLGDFVQAFNIDDINSAVTLLASVTVV